MLFSKKKGLSIDTLIGHSAAVEGDVTFSGGLRLDGRVRGNVTAETGKSSMLVISEKGVVEGEIRPRMTIQMCSNGKQFEVSEVGVLRLNKAKVPALTEGEVGYVIGNIKNVADTSAGDTITDAVRPCDAPLSGYREVKSMVFSGLYPTTSDNYEPLKDALEKYQINDAALIYEPETSIALGFGFRCGFLGLLHMEIIQERLEREFSVDMITTVPNVEYHVVLTDGTELRVESPTALPDPGTVTTIAEPIVLARILCPSEYIGNVQKLCHDRRGIFRDMSYLDPQRVELDFELPLSEIVLDFYDRLKSSTRGYAGLDYEFLEMRPGALVRLDILVNADPVDAFSVIIHEDKAYIYGRDLVRKLKKLIPRQQFPVALQATMGNNVIARTNVKAVRKNVTAKCYGGDITRKRKLLERQKEGKKRMKQVGTVEIPQEAFLAVLSLGDD